MWVLQYEKKVKGYSNGKKIDNSLSYLTNMKAYRVIVSKKTISSKHFILYHAEGLFCKNLKACRFILLHFMCTQIWHLSHCTVWWLLTTALLQILHGNVITIVNCWKSKLVVYSAVQKE